MAKVVLWGSLKPYADGQSEVEIEADNLRDLLARLGDAYPRLRPQLQRGVSVSLDGLIYRDGWLQPVRPDSEIYLLPRMVGG